MPMFSSQPSSPARPSLNVVGHFARIILLVFAVLSASSLDLDVFSFLFLWVSLRALLRAPLGSPYSVNNSLTASASAASPWPQAEALVSKSSSFRNFKVLK